MSGHTTECSGFCGEYTLPGGTQIPGCVAEHFEEKSRDDYAERATDLERRLRSFWIVALGLTHQQQLDAMREIGHLVGAGCAGLGNPDFAEEFLMGLETDVRTLRNMMHGMGLVSRKS